MIFFSIGILFLIIGSLFRILPSKGNLPFMGIIRLLPQKQTLIGGWLKRQAETGFSYGLTDGIDRLLFKDIWAYELFSD